MQLVTASSSREFLFPALNCGGEELFPPPFQAHSLLKELSPGQGCGLKSLIYPGGSECYLSDASEHSRRLRGTEGLSNIPIQCSALKRGTGQPTFEWHWCQQHLPHQQLSSLNKLAAYMALENGALALEGC